MSSTSRPEDIRKTEGEQTSNAATEMSLLDLVNSLNCSDLPVKIVQDEISRRGIGFIRLWALKLAIALALVDPPIRGVGDLVVGWGEFLMGVFVLLLLCGTPICVVVALLSNAFQSFLKDHVVSGTVVLLSLPCGAIALWILGGMLNRWDDVSR